MGKGKRGGGRGEGTDPQMTPGASRGSGQQQQPAAGAGDAGRGSSRGRAGRGSPAVASLSAQPPTAQQPSGPAGRGRGKSSSGRGDGSSLASSSPQPQASLSAQPPTAQQPSGPAGRGRGKSSSGRGDGSSLASSSPQPQVISKPRIAWEQPAGPQQPPLQAPIPIGVRPVVPSPFPSVQKPQPAAAPQPTAAPQPAPAQAAEPSGKGGKKKGKGGAGGGDKPQKEQTRTPSAPSTTSTSTPGGAGELVQKVKGLSVGYEIPRRKQQMIQHTPQFCEKKTRIEVNYLRLTFEDENLKIFHYDCSFNPDKPKSLYREAMTQFKRRNFPNRGPAFDGRKNLYFGGKPLDRDTIRDSVKVTDPERQKEIEFDITIKLVRDQITLQSLMQYMKNGKTKNLPQDVIQAVDIALRSGPQESLLSVGRSFFYPPPPGREAEDLEGGFVLWHGYYQSAVMGWKPYLNVDVANKAFPREQSVLDYMQRDVGCNPADANRNGLDSRATSTMNSFLKGLKIEYRMPSTETGGISKRTYKCNGLDVRENAISHKFAVKDGGPKISVFDYFRKEKNTTLRFPNLPLLAVGSKGTMLPMELCYIIGRQVVMRKLNERQTANMVKNAAKPTDVRKARIMDNISKGGFHNKCLNEEFRINVDLNFEKVDAYVLKSPQLQYRNNAPVQPKDGEWRGGLFLESPALDNWVVLNTDERAGHEVRRVCEMLMSSGRELGIQVSPPSMQKTVSYRGYQSNRDLLAALKEIKSKSPKLCLIILNDRCKDLYGLVKRNAELDLGLLTQCIKSFTATRKFNPMTAKNILLKINAKIHGKNHRLSPQVVPALLTKGPVMIVGADVTHPSPGMNDIPSIAAVTASHDRDGCQYNMMYRLQSSREEMIIELASMIQTQLGLFVKYTGSAPEKILYYRDGVSEGQFHQVLDKELTAIRAACKSFRPNYEPGITFLVVQKRHHTRFFPGPNDSDGSRNKNVRAGTLVDTTITHPTELDFYLVSHKSIQGTARPTKYHLLWDDNGFGEEDIERLTYYLCFMFVRCNRSVSYPAPTYYAHLGAFRARAWFEGERINMGDLQRSQRSISEALINNTPMFFV